MTKQEQIVHKIQTVQEALRAIEGFRLKSETIVFTNGCFDILHAGHITLINEAAALGNRLVVGLNTDNSVRRLKGNSRPLQDESSRALVLASLAFVDIVILFDEATPLELIRTIQPEVLVKGGDYSEDQVVGAKEVTAHGGKVAIIPIKEGYSTTSVIQKMQVNTP